MTYEYKKVRVKDRVIEEHRLVMQEHLGRTLGRYEVVHHKDGNKRNNDISNLEVMSLSNHSRMHMLGKRPTRRPGMTGKRKGNKLNLLQAIKIKYLLKTGLSYQKIADMFSVDKTNIYQIRKGICWNLSRYM